MIEAIVYSLISIDGIDKVIIQVEGEVLTKLPNSNKNIPTILDKNFGINKVYDINTIKDTSQVTTYYLSKNNNDYYYIKNCC